jgi:hypothetical protein
LMISSPALLRNTDACLDDKAEARRVNAHLSAAQTHANSVADSFWADRSKAEALTMLQDQISRPERRPRCVVELWELFIR